MALSNRTKDLILLILDEQDFITVDEIAKRLGISRRTVYRELPEAEEILMKGGLRIESASKRGIAAVGDPADRKKLRASLRSEEDIFIVDPPTRVDFILLYLLNQHDYIKMEAIAIDHGASLSTIRADMQLLHERVEPYDLQMIQQKGQGVRVTGSHMEKSHLMTDILLRRVDETVLFAWMREEAVSDPFLNRIKGYGYQDDIVRVYRELQETLSPEEGLLSSVKARQYLEMVFLLAFLVYYHTTSHRYHEYLAYTRGEEETEGIFRDITGCMEKLMPDGLNDAEAAYVEWVASISLETEGQLAVAVPHEKLNADIMRFINFVEEKTGIYLTRDTDLREGLYTHLDKALVRIRSRMQIENPALAEIREKHGDLFLVVREAARAVFPEDYFPDDEVGYLVLYFALALDKFTKKIFRVIVVCSGGMGSSKVLAHMIEKEIPEIEVEKTLSVVALGNEHLEDYDLILSTIPLYLDDGAYMRVSALPREREIQEIREKVKRHKHGQLLRIDQGERRREIFLNDNNEEILRRITAVGQMGLTLMHSFRILRMASYGNLSSDIQRALTGYRFFREGGMPAITEKGAGFVIPDTGTNYYEGICSSLPHAVMLVIRYEDDTSAIAVLYPKELSGEEGRLMRHLVECIIEDRMVTGWIDEAVSDDLLPEIGEKIRNWIGWRVREYLLRLSGGSGGRFC